MQNEFSFVWEVCPVGLARVSRDGRFLAVNPRLCQITGYSETELLARTFQQITHPDDVVPDSTEAAALAEDSESVCYQMVKRYIRKDGITVWVNLYAYAVRDDQKNFSYYFAFITELSPVVHTNSISSNTSFRETGGKSTLLGYIRDNPREAAVVAAIIVALAQGRNIWEMLLNFIPK